MTVGSIEFPSIPAISGVRLAATSAGIYANKHRPDLVLVELAEDCAVAGVFTQNAFCAAPVQLARQYLAEAAPRFLLINAGNANAGTGPRGLVDAEACCNAVAEHFDVERFQVLPFSTGVIGDYLPVEKILTAIGRLQNDLDHQSWRQAAEAIMTTDTVPKGVYRTVTLASGESVQIAGFAKGSGMIHPDMATMLGYLFTDAVVAPEVLQSVLTEAVAESFNCITVDGDTSTNDSVILAATGCAAAVESAVDRAAFQTAVTDLCVELAEMIVRDGEGATKLITIQVEGGETAQACRQVALTVAHSPLVKTAFFASDPNWGRILAAVGRSGLPQLDVATVDMYLDDVCIVHRGERSIDYTEEQGQAVMDREVITVRIVLNRGDARARMWTTDLSHEYITINAEYRS